MKLIHRVYGTFNGSQQELLAEHNVAVEVGTYTSVDLDDRIYRLVEPQIVNSVERHSKIASFEQSEVERAEWLAPRGLTKAGYPQPEETWGFEDVYDLGSACSSCKLPFGLQEAPFRIRASSRSRPLSQLEWIYGELFASREFHETHLRPIGLGSRPVLIHRSGEVSEKVVQVEIPISEWNFDFSSMPTETCQKCGQRKFLAAPQDFFPRINGTPPNEIFAGPEPFGSGGLVFRHIYVSKRICRLLIDEKIAHWKQFYPLLGGSDSE